MAMKVQGGKMVPAEKPMTQQEMREAEAAFAALEKAIPHTRSLWTKFQAAGLTREAGQMNQAHEMLVKLLLRLGSVLGKR